VVSRLKEVDSTVTDEVDHSMLFREATRPGTGWQVLEGFWLSDTSEWIAEDCLNQIQRPPCHIAIGGDPELEVVDELRVKDPQPLAAGGRAPLANALLRQDPTAFSVR
jgi:hypothetical protein